MLKEMTTFMCCALACNCFADKAPFNKQKDLLLAQFDSNHDPDDIIRSLRWLYVGDPDYRCKLFAQHTEAV